jgi:hypothetical protein
MLCRVFVILNPVLVSPCVVSVIVYHNLDPQVLF